MTEPVARVSENHAQSRRGWRRWASSGVIALVAASAFGLGLCVATDGSARHHHDVSEPEQVWTCPMHPQIRMTEPGPCPICGMELVVIETEGDDDDAEDAETPHRITLTRRARALAQIRTSKVKPMTDQSQGVRFLGRIDYDETRIKRVTAWTAGRIDRLLVASTGTRIRQGQSVARIYSPEFYSTASDLIQARRQVARLAEASPLARETARSTVAAARQRLRLLGVPQAEISAIEGADQPPHQVAIRSPFTGTVIERLVAEGNYVDAGTALYRIVDLSRVWVQLDAYDSDVALLSVGNRVTLEVTGVPGKTFEGEVAFIDPVVDPRTRIIRVRVEVDNRSGELRPGMFAEAVLYSGNDAASDAANRARLTLAIPATAPLFTGRRSVVYVEVPDAPRPTYQAREVTLGSRVGDIYPVLSGLELGERVVSRGAVVLDADLQIKGGASMMTMGDDQTRGADDAAAALPDAFRGVLVDLLDRYLAVREALVRKDLDRARLANRAIEQAIVRATRDVPQRLRALWDPLSVEWLAYSRHFGAAGDLDAARRAFDGMSEDAIALVSRFGNPTDQALQLAVCSNALDGRGARWLQGIGAITNPYGDDEQRSCGDVHATVAAGGRLP